MEENLKNERKQKGKKGEKGKKRKWENKLKTKQLANCGQVFPPGGWRVLPWALAQPGWRH